MKGFDTEIVGEGTICRKEKFREMLLDVLEKSGRPCLRNIKGIGFLRRAAGDT